MEPSKSSKLKVINIRGTSGSGKSTIVFNLLSAFKHRRVFLKSDTKRKYPYGYTIPELNLFIVGKYENQCGGCDSIISIDKALERVHKGYKRGYNVLFEGLMASGIVTKIANLKPLNLHVITLNTELNTCLERVQQRRKEKGKLEPLNPKNTNQKFQATRSSHKSLTAALGDKRIFFLSNEQAFFKTLELLKSKTKPKFIIGSRDYIFQKRNKLRAT